MEKYIYDKNNGLITLEFNRKGGLALARKLDNHPADEYDELAFIEEFRTKILLPYIKSKNETGG